MNINLKVWRQKNMNVVGSFVNYKLSNVNPNMSFLEMFDMLNEKLISQKEDPIAFDHDCREGICGACSMFINGYPHGNKHGVTTCQLHMREFTDNQTIVVEPWRAKAFPVIKDLIVDRSSLDRIISSGGFVSLNTGSARDANEILISKEDAEESLSAASCIGCGACVAACKNASAMLFVGAKIYQFSKLPQGKIEEKKRIKSMLKQMDKENFGHCTNTGACSAECPKEISLDVISSLNKDFIKSSF
ncbi:MAG: succinate dehydrogenase/fumarate reductase iron-sulfur subunit [Bacteroides sp.]|nr:MAG: succinate dehydrogenase/fumarate reductase iron-sulfur subunit [Bacteroides sp.]